MEDLRAESLALTEKARQGGPGTTQRLDAATIYALTRLADSLNTLIDLMRNLAPIASAAASEEDALTPEVDGSVPQVDADPVVVVETAMEAVADVDAAIHPLHRAPGKGKTLLTVAQLTSRAARSESALAVQVSRSLRLQTAASRWVASLGGVLEVPAFGPYPRLLTSMGDVVDVQDGDWVVATVADSTAFHVESGRSIAAAYEMTGEETVTI